MDASSTRVHGDNRQPQRASRPLATNPRSGRVVAHSKRGRAYSLVGRAVDPAQEHRYPQSGVIGWVTGNAHLFGRPLTHTQSSYGERTLQCRIQPQSSDGSESSTGSTVLAALSSSSSCAELSLLPFSSDDEGSCEAPRERQTGIRLNEAKGRFVEKLLIQRYQISLNLAVPHIAIPFLMMGTPPACIAMAVQYDLIPEDVATELQEQHARQWANYIFEDVTPEVSQRLASYIANILRGTQDEALDTAIEKIAHTAEVTTPADYFQLLRPTIDAIPEMHHRLRPLCLRLIEITLPTRANHRNDVINKRASLDRVWQAKIKTGIIQRFEEELDLLDTQKDSAPYERMDMLLNALSGCGILDEWSVRSVQEALWDLYSALLNEIHFHQDGI